MELSHYFFLILIGVGAGFVQRVSGFGLGIFAMMFLPYLLPNHAAAAAVSSLFACMTVTYNAIRYRKNIVVKTALPMACSALIVIPIAVHFSSIIAGNVFEILLGIVLSLLSIYFFFFNKRITIKPTFFNGLLAGTLGGTLGGLFSTGGPPAVLYLSSATANNITYFATIQFYFCFTNLYATTFRVINGIIDLQVLVCALVGMAGCMLGDFIGRGVFDKLDSNRLKQIIYIGMLISGLIMIF